MTAIPSFRSDGLGKVEVKSNREIEYDLFAKITRSLQAAHRSSDFKEKVKSVSENNQLWTTLSEDLIKPGNGLPDSLKAQIISLAIFSIKEGGRIMSDQGDISALIDINVNLMKGLRGGDSQ